MTLEMILLALGLAAEAVEAIRDMDDLDREYTAEELRELLAQAAADRDSAMDRLRDA